MRRRGFIKLDGVKAEEGSGLIAFDGKEWREVIRFDRGLTFTVENSMVDMKAVEASGARIYVQDDSGTYERMDSIVR